MSSKGRAATGHKVDPQGFYQTQPQVTRAIVPYLESKAFVQRTLRDGHKLRVIEPGCGNGAIGKVLRRVWADRLELVGCEINESRARQADKALVIIDGKKVKVFDRVIVGSFFDQGFVAKQFHLSLTNPSFAIWLEVARRSLEIATATTLLLPWNSHASKVRADFWKEHPAYSQLLSKRPSFVRSVKCEATNGKRARELGAELCDYQQLLPLDKKPKKICPLCGLRTTVVSSDSNEYAWVNWSEDITHNRWDPLPTPDPLPEDA